MLTNYISYNAQLLPKKKHLFSALLAVHKPELTGAKSKSNMCNECNVQGYQEKLHAETQELLK